MNLFELFGFFILGSVFNVLLIMLATKSIIKSAGGQVNSLLLTIRGLVDRVLKDGE